MEDVPLSPLDELEKNLANIPGLEFPYSLREPCDVLTIVSKGCTGKVKVFFDENSNQFIIHQIYENNDPQELYCDDETQELYSDNLQYVESIVLDFLCHHNIKG